MSFLIYLIGCFVSYFGEKLFAKYVVIAPKGKERDYMYRILISLSSWLGAFLILIYSIIYFVDRKINPLDYEMV